MILYKLNIEDSGAKPIEVVNSAVNARPRRNMIFSDGSFSLKFSHIGLL